MGLKAFDVNIPEQVRKYNSAYGDDIREFLKSGAESAEVAIKKGLTAPASATAYLQAIKRYPALTGKVKVIRRGNRVFLRRIEKKERTVENAESY